MKDGKTKISPTADNAAVIDNLRDQNALLTNKFLPLVKKWTVTLTKAGDNADSDALKRAIDVKQLLEEVDARVKDLGIDLKRKDREDDSDSDDDDFVEVEEKNGDYEEDVVEPPTETELMTFYPLPKARTSANKSESKLKRSSSEALKSEELDPTTFAATVKKVKSDLGAEDEPIPG